MSDECEGKSSWPELVGADGNEAKVIIERENPLVEAIVVGPGSGGSRDFRCDRVFVWVDESGLVTIVPHIA